jgi:hypothetical protein
MEIGCNSPFQVKTVYSPQLVVYGIIFGSDSTIGIRVETNSGNPVVDTTSGTQISGLAGMITNRTTGQVTQLIASFTDGQNLLRGVLKSKPGNVVSLSVDADGYSQCTASSVILDSAVIYPASWTESALRSPGNAEQDPQFTIYPSSHTMAVRLTISLEYQGVTSDGKQISGEYEVAPSYQQDTTSYFLKIDGSITAITFSSTGYSSVFSQAVGPLSSGKIVAVVTLLQIDASLYDFYSISNGFNDPFTMRTEKPVFTNVEGGLGFWGAARYDSISIPVYP